MILTLGAIGIAYAASLRLRTRWVSLFTTPILTTVAFAALLLFVFRAAPADYRAGAPLGSFLLGPLAAALAIPLVRHRAWMRTQAPTIGGIIIIGVSLTSALALAGGYLAALAPQFLGMLAIKSVTAPIAIQLAQMANIDRTTVATAVIFTGITGATIGPLVLKLAGVRNEQARGLALGCVAHALGAVAAARESERAGAASVVALTLSAIVLACAGGPLVRTVMTVADRDHRAQAVSAVHEATQSIRTP